MRFRQQNLAWLAITGAMVAIAVLAGVATPLQTMFLLAVYGMAVAASLIEVKPAAIVNTVQRGSLARVRSTPNAQEASERARRRGTMASDSVMLLDIGLIATQMTSEGMVMRRSRQVSTDDDGARPYLSLHVAPGQGDRQAVIRFEMTDASGEVQYMHELKTYLRDGDMNILAETQLPLLDSDRLRAGEGDLRVLLDGELLGMLSYTLTPSVEARNRRLSQRQQSSRSAPVRADDSAPMSLEDLMRGSGGSQQNRRDR